MKSAAYFAGYGLALLLPVIAIWIWHSEGIEPVLLTTGMVGFWIIAVLTLTSLGREPGARLIPDSSLATVLLAIGTAMALNGVVFGLWLALIGAEVMLLGAAGLLGEWLTARRTA